MARLTRRTRPIPPWTDDGVYMGAFQGPDDQGLPFVESMTKVRVWHARTCTPCMCTHVHLTDPCMLPFVESMTKAAESLAEVLNFNAGA